MALRFADIARRCRRDEAGNVAVVSAAFLVITMGLATLAVDAGALYLERRAMQNLADLAAIHAAANPEHAEKAVLATLRDNDVANVSLRAASSSGWADRSEPGHHTTALVEKGQYAADPALPVSRRFKTGKRPYDAVKVTLQRPGTLYFGKAIMETPLLTATGTAHATPQAAFSIGSRLLRLDGGVLNAVLNCLLGTSVSLSVADYEALIAANVDVLSFFDELASELDLEAGTYEDVLRASASVAQSARAMAELVGPDSAARGPLLELAAGGSSAATAVPLDRVFDLGPFGRLAVGSGASALVASAAVMEMLAANAAVANGDRQVALDLTSAAPGLAGLTATLAVGEPPQQSPWFRIGEKGQVVRTAQVRLFLEAKAGGEGPLAGLAVRLPIYLELAYAEARLAEVHCPKANIESVLVKIDARPGLADLRVADVAPQSLKQFQTSPLIRQASLVDAPFVRVSGQAHVEVGNSRSQRPRFDYGDIENLTAKTVSTRNVTRALITSLLDKLEMNVKFVGLTVSSPEAVRQSVAELLRMMAPPLDNVIHNLLLAAGVSVGEANVRVHGVRCRRSVLVQ